MKKLVLILSGLTLLLLSSCGDPYQSLAAQEQVDATELKDFCASKKLVTPETKKADSLVVVGNQSLGEENSSAGYLALGQAASLYKIAIANYHGSKADTKITTLQGDLAEDQKSLEGYQALLTEINSTPMPAATENDTSEVSNVQ